MKNDLIYFDTASAGILSKATAAAAAKYDDLLLYNASQVFYNFLVDDLPAIKKETVDFVGVSKDRLAFAPNFSYIFSTFLASVRPKRKRVLLFENDYYSLTQPFIEQEFEITWLKSKDGFTWELDAVETALKTKQIEILAISQVQYLTGQKSDLKELAEICQRNGVLFFVDGTQSFGAVNFNFDESGIDVFFASNYKWMNGGYGSATACFKDGIIEAFKPIIAGYGSFRNIDGKFAYEPSIASYMPGHISMRPLLGFRNAVQEKVAIGLKEVQRKSHEHAQFFVENCNSEKVKLIGPKNMQNRSQIVCIQADEALHAKLLQKGIKTMYRNKSIRIGFHHQNTMQEVEKLLEMLN